MGRPRKYTDPVTTYARRVISGAILAGPHVRDACRRHLADLELAPARGWTFDLKRLKRALEFFPDVLRLAGGEFEGLPFELQLWQAFIVGSLFAWVDQYGFRRFRVAYIEGGKGPLALDTPVPTPSGWSTIGEIREGDHVFDDQGRPTKVIGISPTFENRACFRLEFSDGSEIVADSVHRWNTAAMRNGLKPGPRKDDIRKGGYGKRTTAQIAASLRVPSSKSAHPQAKWNHRVDVAPALDLPDTFLPIKPYTLGAWLGDGDSDAARITGVDQEIFGHIEADGYGLGRPTKKRDTKAVRLTIGSINRAVCRRSHDKAVHANGQHCRACERELDRARRRGEPRPAWYEYSLQERLRECGLLRNKHIPALYLRAGTTQRLSLLQGLMDTDGTVSPGGQCEITLCDETLARDTLALLRTLGFKAAANASDAKIDGRVVGHRWRINFQAYRSFPPFRLKRKRDRLGIEPPTRALSRGRMIVSCVAVHSVPVKCITVAAPSHMFLAGTGLVPTCNCGKSPLAAGIGILMLVADKEPRAEVYAAATTKDQAMVLFRDAVAMVQQSPWLARRIVAIGGQNVWNLAYNAAAAFFRAIASDDGQSGPRPHACLIDEIHEHRDDRVIEMLRAGFKGRRQPLMFMITNSGSDKNSVCFRYHDRGCKIAAGALHDDRFFSYICALDEKDEPFKDPKCWIKTNPNLGVSIQPDYLRDQVLEAVQMPAKENTVLRLHFCKWVETATPWISLEVWGAAQAAFDPDELLDGGDLWLGLDLSVVTDLTAIAKVRRTVVDGRVMYQAAVEFYTPADTVTERAARDRVPYDVWIREGFLQTTPGSELKYEYLAERLAEINGRANVIACAFDRYRIRELKNELDTLGSSINMVEHPQGTMRSKLTDMWMPASIETIEGALLERRLQISENPVLTYCAASAMTETDRQLNRVFTKKKSTGRIDGVVALAMGMGCAQHLKVSVPSITIF